MADDKKASIVAEAEAVVAEVDEFTVKVEGAVEKWLAEHLRNTPFSQDTAAWNVLQKALPHLAPAIVEGIK